MISAISITQQVDLELVTAPRHWGSRVKGFIVDTFGTWRDKILTAAAVYEVVQAVFLILGGYFLAGVISAAMSALFVKTIKELKEHASLDRPISLLQEEGYRHGLHNLQQQRNNLDMAEKLAVLQQGLDRFAQHNNEYGLQNIEHRAANAEHRVNNAEQRVNNEVHAVNNTVQQGNNYVHSVNNAMAQDNNYGYWMHNTVHAELNIQNMIMFETFSEAFRQHIADGMANNEEYRAKLRQNYEEYKSHIKELSDSMKQAGDEHFGKAAQRMADDFKVMTDGVIEITRENREQLQRDRASFEEEKILLEEKKQLLLEKEKQLEKRREECETYVIKAGKVNNETHSENNAALSKYIEELEKRGQSQEAKMSLAIDEMRKLAQDVANDRRRMIQGNA